MHSLPLSVQPVTVSFMLNNFLSDTEFPYDASVSGGNDRSHGGMGGFGGPDGVEDGGREFRKMDEKAGFDGPNENGAFGSRGNAEESPYEEMDDIPVQRFQVALQSLEPMKRIRLFITCWSPRMGIGPARRRGIGESVPGLHRVILR